MKNVYDAAKQILNERRDMPPAPNYTRSEPEGWSLSGIINKISDYSRNKELAAARRDDKEAYARIEKEQEAKHAAAEAEKARREREAKQNAPQPTPAAAKPAPETKPAKAAKPLSFDKEFAKQYKEKGEGGTFDWKDPKTGKVTKIALKLKDNAPEDKEATSKLADYNAMQKKSSEKQREIEKNLRDDEEDMKEDVYDTFKGILEAEKIQTNAGARKDSRASQLQSKINRIKSDRPTTKLTMPKKSAFQTEFDRQYKEKGPGKTFTWTDPTTGKSREILLKRKEETSAQKPAEQKPVDQKLADYNALQAKSVEAQKLNYYNDSQAKSVEAQKKEYRRAEDLARLQKAAGEDMSKVEPPKAPEADQEDEIEKIIKSKQKEKSDKMWSDLYKEKEDEAKKLKAEYGEKYIYASPEDRKRNTQTNEGKQMSINKKFNVSDSLYSSVMEVLQKSSGGTVPSNKKEKKLAAMHGDPSVITHGDVLKARGVKMKEEVESIEEAKKLVSKHGAEGQKYTAKVYKDPEYNEYQVHYFKDGKHMGEGPVSYHGDDKEDAQNTADHEIKRMNSIKEGFEIVAADQLDELSRGKLVSYVNKVAGLKGKSAGTHQAGLKAAAQRISAMKRGKKEEPMTSSGPKKTGAGILLAAARKRASGEAAMEQRVLEGTMRNGKYVDDAPRPGTNEVPVPDEGWRPKQAAKPAPAKKPSPTKAGSTTKAMDDSEE